MSQPHRTDEQDRASFQDQAERLSRKVTESAQQVWLAGLGALGRAQAEGSKLFDTLVKEGEQVEARTRENPDKGEPLRDSVEQTFGQARERASGAWEKLEKGFDDRVHGVLRRLQIPNRDDVDALNARIDALTARLNRVESRTAASDAAAASEAAKAAPSPNPPTD